MSTQSLTMWFSKAFSMLYMPSVVIRYEEVDVDALVLGTEWRSE